VKRFDLVLPAVLAICLGGCAEAILPGGPGGTAGMAPTALTVTPSSASIAGLASQQFTAKTGDGSTPTVVWSVNGVAGGNATYGTIDAKGLYAAPEFPPAPNTIRRTRSKPPIPGNSGMPTRRWTIRFRN